MIVRAAAVLFVLLAIAMAGCGEDDSGASDATTIETSSLTKAQFVKQAEKICSRGTEGLLPLISAYLERNSRRGQDEEKLGADAMRAVAVPQIEAQIEKIRALGAPSGDEDQIEAFLVAQQDSLNTLKVRKRVSLRTGLNPIFHSAGKLARDYGIDVCGYG